MRAAIAALAAGLALAGCGAPAGDLLALEVRGGPGGSETRIVLTDDGRARCDGGELRSVENADLIEAREIARELEGDAEAGRAYPGGAADGRSYVARTREGTVRWSEGATGRPEVLPRAELFALRLSRSLCA